MIMKNKTFLTVILILTSLFGVKAQDYENSEDALNISVIVPIQIEGLTYGQLSKLESKMLRMVSNHGIAGEGYTDKFILYPKYEIYDHKVVEGMQNVHVLDVELNLIVKEVKTGKVYSVFNQEITGDGYSKNEAINQSISQIKTRGDKIERFLQNAKTKILDYYRSNCDRLYDEADKMINQKRYNEAIALLYPIPIQVGGDCYKKIQRKLDEAYNGYLNETCEKNLVRAKAEISRNNKGSALEILGSIEVESNCHSSAQQLKSEIQTKNAKDEKDSDTSTSNAELVKEEKSDNNDDSTESSTDVLEVNKNSVTITTSKPSSEKKNKPKKTTRREKMKEIANVEFKRTRHQGEIDRAIQEG